MLAKTRKELADAMRAAADKVESGEAIVGAFTTVMRDKWHEGFYIGDEPGPDCLTLVGACDVLTGSVRVTLAQALILAREEAERASGAVVVEPRDLLGRTFVDAFTDAVSRELREGDPARSIVLFGTKSEKDALVFEVERFKRDALPSDVFLAAVRTGLSGPFYACLEDPSGRKLWTIAFELIDTREGVLRVVAPRDSRGLSLRRAVEEVEDRTKSRGEFMQWILVRRTPDETITVSIYPEASMLPYVNDVVWGARNMAQSAKGMPFHLSLLLHRFETIEAFRAKEFRYDRTPFAPDAAEDFGEVARIDFIAIEK